MTTAIFSAPKNTTAATDIMNPGGTGWVDKLIAALVAVGFIQTADEGQATAASVLASYGGPGSGLTAGFVTFRFNDTLQSTAPLSFRIDIGDSGGGDHSPGFQIAVGKGTDGVGNIVGGIHQAGYHRGLGNDTNPYKSYISSGDGSMLTMAMFINNGAGYQNATDKGIFMLERSRDGSGNATAVGTFCHRAPNAQDLSNGWTEFANYASGTSNFTFRGPVPTVYNIQQNTGFNNGINTPIWKPIGIDPAGNMWTPRCMVAYADGDLGFCQLINVDGVQNQNYLALGYNCSYADMARQQGCNHAIAFW